MPKLIHTTGFYFGSARYHLTDTFGNQVVLLVDYWHNKFHIHTKTGQLTSDFKKEIASLAANLLSRKHRVNFVEHLNNS